MLSTVYCHVRAKIKPLVLLSLTINGTLLTTRQSIFSTCYYMLRSILMKQLIWQHTYALNYQSFIFATTRINVGKCCQKLETGVVLLEMCDSILLGQLVRTIDSFISYRYYLGNHISCQTCKALVCIVTCFLKILRLNLNYREIINILLR